jgi:predicted RNA methylase
MKVIRLVKPKPDDVVFDLGCGKGRVVCHFARRHVRKVVGIEISESLSKIAENNARTLRKPHAPIEIRNTDAAIADVSDGTIFFMFNPFGPETLRSVLKNIEKSRDIEVMPVRLIYMNPTSSQVFGEFPWLKIAFDYRRLTRQRVIIYHSRNMDA